MHLTCPPFRVRYADTDAQGVAYYGSYFAWMEVGEIHFLEQIGLHVPDLERRGLVLTVAETYMRYRRPASYGDLLAVRTRVLATAPKRFLLENQIVRVEDGAVLAVGRLSDVVRDASGGVQPVPEPLVERAEQRVERVVISPRVARYLVPTPLGAPEHTHEIRVRYAETDAQGVAYYGSYFTWFEEGRNELTRAMGLPYSEIERGGTVLPVAEAYCRYLAPLRPCDRFLMTTAVPAAEGARMTFSNRMASLDGQAPIALGFTVHACTGPDGRPHGLDPELVERFSPTP
ncbi:MAG: acyl-CoA thioesterase [Planctomycetota bacterium]